MSKQVRIYLTVEQGDKDLLEEWAESQGRTLTNLSTWVILSKMREAIASGEFTPKT